MSPNEQRIVRAELSRDQDVQLMSKAKQSIVTESISIISMSIPYSVKHFGNTQLNTFNRLFQMM